MSHLPSQAADSLQLSPPQEDFAVALGPDRQSYPRRGCAFLERSDLESYTTSEIACQASVSIGSVCQYFPSKDAITIGLIERERATLVSDVQSALALADPAQALRAMIQVAVRNQLQRPKLAQLLDFEDDRLAAAMPPSSNAAAAYGAIINFFLT